MSHLTIGDPAPWFIADTTSNSTFRFETVGGYRIIVSFLGSSQFPQGHQVLQQFAALQDQFAAAKIPFFGVIIHPDDRALLTPLVQNSAFFKLVWDFDLQVSALYGVVRQGDTQTPGEKRLNYTPTTFVLNQNLQVLGIFSLQSVDRHVEQVMNCVTNIPVYPAAQMADYHPPVLRIPHVLPPEFCRSLIDLYETDGGKVSGFMREVEGQTVAVLDNEFKRRRDLLLEEPILLKQLNTLVLRRIRPEIAKAFQFEITRFERYLVACYEAENQGFFRRHRDNTTKGTAHRRFAMTLNLNAGEYEGGCLWFPEYGSQLYRPETGEAVIFSCSLLHEATPVLEGRRFALLSFFYNDGDAQVREQNRQYLKVDDQKVDD